MELDSSFLFFLAELKNSYGKLIVLDSFLDNVLETFLHISKWVNCMAQWTLLSILKQYFITVKKHTRKISFIQKMFWKYISALKLQSTRIGNCNDKTQCRCLVTLTVKKFFLVIRWHFLCESIASGLVLGAIKKSLALSYLLPSLKVLHNLMSSTP